MKALVNEHAVDLALSASVQEFGYTKTAQAVSAMYEHGKIPEAMARDMIMQLYLWAHKEYGYVPRCLQEVTIH